MGVERPTLTLVTCPPLSSMRVCRFYCCHQMCPILAGVSSGLNGDYTCKESITWGRNQQSRFGKGKCKYIYVGVCRQLTIRDSCSTPASHRVVQDVQLELILLGLSSNQIHQQKPVRHSIRVIGQNAPSHAHENVSLSHHWHARFPCPGLTFLRICAAFGLLPASLSPRHSQTQCSLRESKLGLGRTSSGPRSTCNCRPTIIRLSVLVQTRRVSTQNTHFLPLSESSDVFTARKRRTSW